MIEKTTTHILQGKFRIVLHGNKHHSIAIENGCDIGLAGVIEDRPCQVQSDADSVVVFVVDCEAVCGHLAKIMLRKMTY